MSRLSLTFEAASPLRPIRASASTRSGRSRPSPALAGRRGEDLVRELVEVGGRPLEDVGEPRDDGVDEPEEHGEPAREERTLPLEPGVQPAEGPRLGIAERHQPVALDDEGDLGRGGGRLVRVHRHGRGEVERIALLVDPRRGLDLAHLLAGRHLDAQHPLDEALLLGGRAEQIDPDDLLGNGGLQSQLDGLERTAVASEGAEHRFRPRWPAPAPPLAQWPPGTKPCRRATRHPQPPVPDRRLTAEACGILRAASARARFPFCDNIFIEMGLMRSALVSYAQHA